MNIKKLLEILLNIIYPPKCGICGKIDNNYLCKKCEKKIKNESEFNIIKNIINDNEYNELMYIFKYEGIIRKILLQYKFEEKAYLYKTIINFLLNNKKFVEKIKTYDTIIPVPISRKRKRERGYNQSYLLAKEISNAIGIKICNNCLFKTYEIIEQSKLNKKDREINIKGVYELKEKEKIKGKKILVLDDIYTTGSTVNECCKVLKEGKPSKLGVLVIAKD